MRSGLSNPFVAHPSPPETSPTDPPTDTPAPSEKPTNPPTNDESTDATQPHQATPGPQLHGHPIEFDESSTCSDEHEPTHLSSELAFAGTSRCGTQCLLAFAANDRTIVRIERPFEAVRTRVRSPGSVQTKVQGGHSAFGASGGRGGPWGLLDRTVVRYR